MVIAVKKVSRVREKQGAYTIFLTPLTQLTLHRPFVHLQAILKLHILRIPHNHVQRFPIHDVYLR